MEIGTPTLLWFLAGVVLFLLEISVPGFILFFFAAGAWLTAAASWLFPLSLNAQILVFIMASLVSLFCLRTFVKKVFTGGLDSGGRDNSLAEAGERVVVVHDILPPAEGKIKYSGTTWRARAGESILSGEIAEIVEQDGLVMVVKRVEDSGI